MLVKYVAIKNNTGDIVYKGISLYEEEINLIINALEALHTDEADDIADDLKQMMLHTEIEN